MKYKIPLKKLIPNGYSFNNRNYKTYYKDLCDRITIWIYVKYGIITISQWGGDIDEILNFYKSNINNNKILKIDDNGEKFMTIRINLKDGKVIENQTEIDKLINDLYSWKFWLWKKSQKRLNILFDINKKYYHRIDLYENDMNLLFKELQFLTLSPNL